MNQEKKHDDKFVYKPKFGKDLKIAAANAVVLARTKKQDIVLDYNGIKIDVTPKTGIGYIMNMFFSLSASNGFPQLENTLQK